MLPADPKEDVARCLNRHLPLLELLPAKEQLALRSYYFDSQTLRDTGAFLGLTREATRALIARALWHLRHQLPATTPGSPLLSETRKKRGLSQLRIGCLLRPWLPRRQRRAPFFVQNMVSTWRRIQAPR